MISWIILGISFFVAVGMLIATREKMFAPKKVLQRDFRGNVEEAEVEGFNLGWLFMPILIFVVGFFVAIFQPYALDRVEQGSVGIKVNLTGDDRGISDYTYETGWVTYNTWTESLYMFPVYQQHVEYPDQIVITKGGFSATIKPTFNYQLKSDAVGDMFQALRLPIADIEQGWLKTAVVGSVNDVANKWAVDDIFNKREEFEAAIIQECNKRVSKWFTLSQLRTNITPPPALKESIEAKTAAVQQAQAEDQKAKVADAQAKVKIANARGDSAEVVIRAQGNAEAKLIAARSEAEAMRLKQLQLSQIYVEYLKAQSWDGKLPSTILGGATPMINLK